MKIEEISNIITKSVKELAIDEEKDEDIKQYNQECRRGFIGCLNLFIDRELYYIKQLIDDTYDIEFPENEEGGSKKPDFCSQMDNLELHLSSVRKLVEARAYLEARYEGFQEDNQDEYGQL
jgi:hypothetical protein